MVKRVHIAAVGMVLSCMIMPFGAGSALAAVEGQQMNCYTAGFPATVASRGYQNNPSDLLLVEAAGESQVRINANSLTVVARSSVGWAGAVSSSLNYQRSIQYRHPR